MSDSLKTSSFNGSLLHSSSQDWPTETHENIALNELMFDGVPYTHGMVVKRAASPVYYIPQEFSVLRNLLRQLASNAMVLNPALVNMFAVMYHFDEVSTEHLTIHDHTVMFNLRTGVTEVFSADILPAEAHARHNIMLSWVDTEHAPEVPTLNLMLN